MKLHTSMQIFSFVSPSRWKRRKAPNDKFTFHLMGKFWNKTIHMNEHKLCVDINFIWKLEENCTILLWCQRGESFLSNEKKNSSSFDTFLFSAKWIIDSGLYSHSKLRLLLLLGFILFFIIFFCVNKILNFQDATFSLTPPPPPPPPPQNNDKWLSIKRWQGKLFLLYIVQQTMPYPSPSLLYRSNPIWISHCRCLLHHTSKLFMFY